MAGHTLKKVNVQALTIEAGHSVLFDQETEFLNKSTVITMKAGSSINLEKGAKPVTLTEVRATPAGENHTSFNTIILQPGGTFSAQEKVQFQISSGDNVPLAGDSEAKGE